MKYSDYFKDKKVTVMGLGLLGRGVGDTEFLAQAGADLIVTDLKTKEELKESVARLEKYPNITFVLGEHRLEDFKDRDMILKAAGIPLYSPYIEEAKKNNIPIEMSASLFTKLSGVPVIGVTGTRGKSTVTHMLYEILKAAGKDVLLGGNVKGIATLPLLNDVRGKSIALFELDSWQLQGFGESKISPHIAIFTTFFEDHMNYYKSDPEQYLRDKANIFQYQNGNDVLVLGSQCAKFIQEKYPNIKSKTIVPNLYDISYKLGVPGEHNRYNAGLVEVGAKELDIDEETIRKVLSEFKGVPGRLELVCNISGVKYYNDTTSTTPISTLAGLKALRGEGGIILIMGGADKELDMSELIKELPSYTKHVILLDGTGTEKVKDKITHELVAKSMEEAVLKAQSLAKEGNVVLMSPAFASFGMFKNEFDRGDQFTEAVYDL
ncbi:MAG: UDP-N-acetylmuramoyl-L-alanine--D-glutamate ligase [Candidatus Paceibacterota bacterium]